MKTRRVKFFGRTIVIVYKFVRVGSGYEERFIRRYVE
jgi:hypothetical protein